MSWWEGALCLDDPIFLSESRNQRHAVTLIADQRAVCGACPAREACLSAALKEEKGRPLDHRHTMRGGLTPSERMDLVKGTCEHCGDPTKGASCLSCSFTGTNAVRADTVPKYELTCIVCGSIAPSTKGNSVRETGVCGLCARREDSREERFNRRAVLGVVA